MEVSSCQSCRHSTIHDGHGLIQIAHWGGYALQLSDPKGHPKGNEDGKKRKLPPNLYFAGDSGFFSGF